MKYVAFRESRYAIEENEDKYGYYDITNRSDKAMSEIVTVSMEPDVELEFGPSTISVRNKHGNSLSIQIKNNGFDVIHNSLQCKYNHNRELFIKNYKVSVGNKQDLEGVLVAFLQHYVAESVSKHIYATVSERLNA